MPTPTECETCQRWSGQGGWRGRVSSKSDDPDRGTLSENREKRVERMDQEPFR